MDQTTDWIRSTIPGAKELIDWFGCWPSFHDAEILELHLSRESTSWLKIHTWNMTQKVDPTGFIVLDKHVVVTFKMEEIKDLELSGFNHQNVIFGLVITQSESGISLTLENCYGLSGRLVAKSMDLILAPGNPDAGA